MRKHLLKLLTIVMLLLILMSGCKKEGAKIVGETSHGTPIVEIDDTISWNKTNDSDCFSAIAYDADNNILYVKFKDSGAEYRYLDFPSSEWRWFNKSDSLGRYYNKNIKGKYECQKLSE